MDITSLRVLFLLLSSLSCFLTSSDAVQCYSCSSHSDGNCEDINKATISTCDYGETCYKAYVESEPLTVRSCGPKTKTGCREAEDEDNAYSRLIACFCETDLCNVGLKLFSSSVMLISCTLVAIFFRQQVLSSNA